MWISEYIKDITMQIYKSFKHPAVQPKRKRSHEAGKANFDPHFCYTGTSS